MVEQYLSIEKSRELIPACIYETPVWRYLLYKTQQDIFDDVTLDPAVPSQPFSITNVIIDGVQYNRRDLAGTRANPNSWTQDGETISIHYADGFPAWLFYSHAFGTVIGRSSGKTRFFDGRKYSAGLDIKLQYKIEADNLEYAKMKFIGGTHNIPTRGSSTALRTYWGTTSKRPIPWTG